MKKRQETIIKKHERFAEWVITNTKRLKQFGYSDNTLRNWVRGIRPSRSNVQTLKRIGIQYKNRLDDKDFPT